MNDYNLFYPVDESYTVLVVMCNSDSPLQYLEDIEKKLLSEKICGNVLIDQILHVGNTEERFIGVVLNNRGFEKESLKFVQIPKTSQFRQLSCNYLRDERLVDFSILSTIQKRMISKGISI